MFCFAGAPTCLEGTETVRQSLKERMNTAGGVLSLIWTVPSMTSQRADMFQDTLSKN